MSEERRDQDEQRSWAELGATWRADGAGDAFAAVDPAAVRARAAVFARRIRRRNVREVAAGALVIAGGVAMVIRSSEAAIRIGGALMAAGAAVLIAILLRHGRPLPPPAPDAPTRDVLVHERAELERQARLLERAWLWYLGPLVPSMVAIEGTAIARAAASGHGLGFALGSAAFTTAAFVAIGWLNARAARSLRARSERLGLEGDGA